MNVGERRIDKDILRNLAEKVDDVVFISGTNGKTTVTSLIGDIFQKSRLVG